MEKNRAVALGRMVIREALKLILEPIGFLKYILEEKV
jgi:hypothetical protein